MVEYEIHPSIGIARVGNAPRKFYIGPETYRALPINPDGRPFEQSDLRDEASRLCRQAARFRVYRIDGDSVEEVTLDTANVKSILWTVHLANKKPSWYEFVPLQGQDGYAPNHPLRNASHADRHALLIDAGPRQIAGPNQSNVHFNREGMPAGYRGAHFPPGPLYPTLSPIDTLGELQTDARGRLLVLGGYGISGTTDPMTTPTTTDGGTTRQTVRSARVSNSRMAPSLRPRALARLSHRRNSRPKSRISSRCMT